MSQWLDDAVLRAEQVDDWLAVKRQPSLQLLRDSQWPGRKTEAWKYTPLNTLAEAKFAAANSEQVPEVAAIDGLETIDLVFVDGQLTSEETTDLPSGLQIQSIANASAEMQSWALANFNQAKPERHLFGLVNDALATAGVLIDVADAAVIDKPVRIVSRLSDGSEAHTRVLVRIGAGAKATVIEDFSGSANSFNTGFAEYLLAAGARLEHYRFALQTGKAMVIGGCHFNLLSKAELNSTVVGFGSDLSRLDIDVNHCGEFSHAKLNAIYLLDGHELFDLHSTIEHTVPNGTTVENVSGIVADHARAVFNGRIHIHRNAQKTLAELNNRNLLLSRNAEINTKPELEIYADDVRCAHGATVAEIDKGALYYLQSRGISRGQAQVMLSFGFINELVDQMRNYGNALLRWR
jgi:Fe-S cluster assembly protein SufD